MSNSLASMHQQQNKQAILWVAKNEMTKSARNKSQYQLVYTVKQKHKSTLNTWKSQSSTVFSELPWLGGPILNITGCASVIVSMLSLIHDMFTLAFLVLLYSAVLPGPGLVFSVSSNLSFLKLQPVFIQGSYKSHTGASRKHKIIYEWVL